MSPADAGAPSCPAPGSVDLGEWTHKDLVWTYRQPLLEALPVRDLLAFYNERVDIVVDGVRLERPVTIFS